MRVDLFDFTLPPERIALRPAEPRETARLLEVGQGGSLADRSVEHLLADRRRLVADTRVGAVVAPGRQLAAGHLVQRGRSAVALGGGVPRRPAHRAEERVAIAAGTGGDVGVGNAGEREIEEHHRRAALGVGEDPDVVGLDVAVPDLMALEVGQRIEELAAEPVELVGEQEAVRTELMGQGLLTRQRHLDRGA